MMRPSARPLAVVLFKALGIETDTFARVFKTGQAILIGGLDGIFGRRLPQPKQ